MSNKPATLTALLRSDEAPEQRERLYLFTITSVAVFLVVLLAVARPPQQPPAKAVVLRPTSSDDGPLLGFPGEGAEAINSDEHLRQAIAAVQARSPEQISRRAIDHFRQHLAVEQPAPAAGHHQELLIRYDGSWAIGASVVNHLVEQYVDQHSSQVADEARQAYQQATLRLKEARDEAEATQERVDDFLAEHFDHLQQGVAFENEPLAMPPTLAPAAPASEPRLVRNPHRVEMRQELESLEREMRSLLVKLNDDHPLVQSLQLEIDQAEHQLNQLAEMVPHESELAGEPSEPQISISERAAKLEQHRQQRARYNRLVAAHRRAMEEFDQAKTAAEEARAHLRHITATQMTVGHWAQRRPHDRTTPLAIAFLALVVAMVCGGVAARGVPHDPTFRNPAHAQRVLGVAIAGCIADPTLKHDSNQGRWPAFVRLIRRTSELALLAVLLLLIGLVLNDRQFALQLAADPLTAISLAGEQLAAWLR